MKLRRLTLLGIAIIAAGSDAFAQYPSRPIRVVIPFPGGGGPMNLAGRVVQLMAPSLGQQLVLDNRPGADGAIGADVVIKAAPDGHTLFLGSSSALSALPHLRKKPPFDPITAFEPIGMIGRITFFLMVHPSLPVKSVAELIAHARANPGKLSYGSGNTTSIVMMAQFLAPSRLDIVHVPYKGDVAALSDFVAGRVQVMFGATTFVGLMKEGRLRPLAVMLPQRTSIFPDVPSVEEAGLGLVTVRTWAALVAPAKTPKPIIERLNRELNAVLAKPEGRELLDRESIDPQAMTPAELGGYIRSQLDIWGKAISDAGIQPD
jgi:tripartite-type tricarboxylate transporter receptor subunit TctC